MRRILEFPPKFRMLRPTGTLIITSDEEMERLEKDPGMKLRAFDSSFTDICRNLPGRGGTQVDVAYDFFFGGNERKYFPTSDQCIRTFRVLHDIAEQQGLGFGASVMSRTSVPSNAVIISDGSDMTRNDSTVASTSA